MFIPTLTPILIMAYIGATVAGLMWLLDNHNKVMNGIIFGICYAGLLGLSALLP